MLALTGEKGRVEGPQGDVWRRKSHFELDCPTDWLDTGEHHGDY